MSADRAALDLQHMTERLLACRDKPKRQYFVEQIGRIWNPGRQHSSFRPFREPTRLHHPPTDASIQAVTSFASDPSHFVRHAVAKSLSSHPEAAVVSITAFMSLLGDADASVRIAAADGLCYADVPSNNAEKLVPFLQDSIWLVRWGVAAALSSTTYRRNAWDAMKTSIPANAEHIDSWSWRARNFVGELQTDVDTLAKLRECVESLGRRSPFGYATKALLAMAETRG
ncbi:HEAT repeat protein [Rubripirellula tenax]|uniref:HEAT repeat protein n=1 Tax=Rubripirellula tenax TaxID=2528015 RepID=A0A5C6EN47_9BACT|nr:HEAT repeat domain-containing protein [Rubripirellula tenax]TWU48996.1 HEAT repeat protein [Rubripirellula tenax]